MTEAVANLLNKLEPARVPSLPHLLLHYPLLSAEAGSRGRDATYAELLAEDEALCLQLLSRYHDLLPDDVYHPRQLCNALGSARIEAALAGAALQSAFVDWHPRRVNFHKLHWRHASYCAGFMEGLAQLVGMDPERAAFCGRFTNCGELLLEGYAGDDYLALHEMASSEADLAGREIDRFGCSHAEIGAALLRGWGVDGFLCDALQFHLESRDDIADAGRLVKMLWLANAMAQRNPPGNGTLGAAKALLGLDEKALHQLDEDTRRLCREREEAMGILQTGGPRLPLTCWESEAVARRDLDKRQRLQAHARSLGQFNAVRGHFTGSADPEEFADALGTSLGQLFGLRAMVLYRFDAPSRTLRPLLARPRRERLRELVISCSRSGEAECMPLLLRCFREGAPQDSAERETATLAVVDRQLLGALGESQLYCEPVYAGARVLGVLVLGLSRRQRLLYQEQSLAARLLLREVAAFLGPAGTRQTSAAALPEQKLRMFVHEINNPLSIIQNYLELLGRREMANEEVKQDIEVIKAEISRIGQLTATLKGEPQQPARQVELNTLIERQARLYRAGLLSEHQLSLTLDLAPGLPPLSGRAEAITQILSNLVLNAAQAMQGGGTLTLRTGTVTFGHGCRYVEMQVEDEGPGIPAPLIDGLFYYGGGAGDSGHMGAGLAVVRELVDAMGGMVSCRSGSLGTRFDVLLPVSERVKRYPDGQGKDTAG